MFDPLLLMLCLDATFRARLLACQNDLEVDFLMSEVGLTTTVGQIRADLRERCRAELDAVTSNSTATAPLFLHPLSTTQSVIAAACRLAERQQTHIELHPVDEATTPAEAHLHS